MQSRFLFILQGCGLCLAPLPCQMSNAERTRRDSLEFHLQLTPRLGKIHATGTPPSLLVCLDICIQTEYGGLLIGVCVKDDPSLFKTEQSSASLRHVLVCALQVTDLRILSQGSVLQWEGNSVINSCSWQPDGSLIMSAGIDHTIKLWDPRKGSNSPPLHTLKGHSEIYGAGKCIYHPIFYDHGRFIVTPGVRLLLLQRFGNG